MGQLFDFVVTTTIIGIVLWPCVFVLLQLFGLVGVLIDWISGLDIDEMISPERFRVVLFLQTIVIWGIYSAVFATVAVSFVTNRHVTASWFFGLSGLLLMTFFVFIIVRTSARNPNGRDVESGNIVGVRVALVGYTLFYKYPQMLGHIPGAVAAYKGLISLTEWLRGVWFLRGLLSLLAFGALFPLLWLIFYWMSVGFGRLKGASQRPQAREVRVAPVEALLSYEERGNQAGGNTGARLEQEPSNQTASDTKAAPGRSPSEIR